MKTSFGLILDVVALAIFNVSAATHYVSLTSTNPTPPYTNWVTAATNIQQAVDAAAGGDTVLVTNGVYEVGQREAFTIDTNQQPPQLVNIGPTRVVVPNAIRLESVNGPLLTTIKGGEHDEYGLLTNIVRCVFLGTNAVLRGFTLKNGCTSSSIGAGLYCESATAVVSDCVLTGNSDYDGGSGGGAYGGTLNNCLLTGNRANDGFGGGASRCTLYNCTLAGNSAVDTIWPSHSMEGGGAFDCTLYNCRLMSNSVHGYGGGASRCTLYNCTLSGNRAVGGNMGWGGKGGGAYYSTLNNCILTTNSAACPGYIADGEGGGAYGGTLNNCVLTANSAGGGWLGWGGGGAHASTLNNCIVYDNRNRDYEDSALSWCCTTEPKFVDYAGGDFRLRPDSPCIDAGTNLTGILSTDILGLPRPMDGDGDGIARFDIGAYEFNPYRFAPTLHLSASGFQFTVCGEPGRSVRIERSRDLVNWEFAGEVPIPIGGQTLIDPAATSESKLFYRAVRVP